MTPFLSSSKTTVCGNLDTFIRVRPPQSHRILINSTHDPNHAHAYYSRALAKCKIGDCAEAITDYSSAIQRDPNSPMPIMDEETSEQV
jgi:hypothetical protein